MDDVKRLANGGPGSSDPKIRELVVVGKGDVEGVNCKRSSGETGIWDGLCDADVNASGEYSDCERSCAAPIAYGIN